MSAIQRGDISNDVPPRYLITFDALYRLPNSDSPSAKLAEKMHRWSKALSYYELEQEIADRLWMFTQRTGVRWDVLVIDKPEEFIAALEKRLDSDGVYVVNAVSTPSAHRFQGTLAHRPDICGIVDVPQRALMWGSRTFDIRSI